MSNVLLVTKKESNFSAIAEAIKESGSSFSWSFSGGEALETIRRETVDLVIVDEELGDMTGLSFLKEVVVINAMINSALVSSLPEKEYHEFSEGLGIVMQLPSAPEKSDGERLMSLLYQILGISGAAPKK